MVKETMNTEEEIEFWKSETKFWRDAFSNAKGLREDAEKEIREQKVLIERLKDRVWWLSGGF